MISPNDYVKLSNLSYLVDEEKAKKEGRIPIIDDSTIKDSDLIHSYKVLDAKDNPDNGFQAMAVAPLKPNGEPDLSQIVIAYAGTNSSDVKDLATDLQMVVGYAEDRYTNWWGGTSDSQLASAKEFANNIKKEYKNAEITTTGHSLGEFLALFIAAENQWANTGFNGPDPYKYLSDEAKEWIKNNPGMLKNYRNKLDVIGNSNGNKTGAEILVDVGGVSSLLDAHNLSLWSVLMDSEGNLVLPDEKSAEGKIMKQRVALLTSMNTLGQLRGVVLSSGKGSASEEIFFDDAEVLTVIENISTTVEQSVDEMIKACQEGIDEAAQAWEDGLNRARGIGMDLNEAEVIEALAAGGATESSIVAEPTAYYNEEIAKVKAIQSEYTELIASIQSSVQKLAAADSKIAGYMEALNL